MSLLPPAACWLGLYLNGLFTPGLLYLGLIIMPIIELFVPASIFNEDEVVYEAKQRIRFFDILLYLQLPMMYFILFYFGWQWRQGALQGWEIFFSILNVGMMIGVSGINTAHELGHRQRAFDQVIARLLLLPALYSHYTLEHNYGHHLKVGTPEDPATARRNEWIYAFYFRTITGTYINAWEINHKMLKAKNKPAWMNEIIWTHVLQLIYLFTIYQWLGLMGLLLFVGAAFVGILFLESVNYIEHYGLVRKKMPSGRYEPMRDSHSWNSNHELGRMVLFELVRHADHHFQTTRKYQALRHLDQSPQLPFGYPMSILLALVPPLWFKVMNNRIG